MHRFPVFYSSLPDIGAGFRPVEAEDSYETEQIVQREYPGAITASLSENMTDEKEVRRLFVEWLKTLWLNRSFRLKLLQARLLK